MKNCEWFADGGFCRKTGCSGEPCIEQVAAATCRSVAELPDRSSPEDWPEAMLVTHDELRQIVLDALAHDGVPPTPTDDGPMMQRGTRGDGSVWMGTMRECLEDAQEAAKVEAALGDEARAEVKRLRALLDANGVLGRVEGKEKC